MSLIDTTFNSYFKDTTQPVLVKGQESINATHSTSSVYMGWGSKHISTAVDAPYKIKDQPVSFATKFSTPLPFSDPRNGKQTKTELLAGQYRIARDLDDNKICLYHIIAGNPNLIHRFSVPPVLILDLLAGGGGGGGHCNGASSGASSRKGGGGGIGASWFPDNHTYVRYNYASYGGDGYGILYFNHQVYPSTT